MPGRCVAIRSLVALVVVTSLASCKRDRDSSTTNAEAVQARAEAEFLPQGEHLLFLPDGDPGALLGRAVSFASDGTITIASERTPGCRVNTKSVSNSFTKTYRQEAEAVAGINVGIAGFAELSGDYRRSLMVEISVSNTEILRADVEGDCGDQVVLAVRVGVGARTLLDAEGGQAAVEIRAPGAAKVRASGGASDAKDTALRWDSPQAWAVEVGDGNRGGDEITILMPEQLTHGRPYELEIEVAKPMYLIVLYLGADGHHGVVLPRGPHKSFHAAGQRTTLPNMTAHNLPGSQEDHETLIVFGFGEEADFRLFKPPGGSLAPDEVDRYVEEVEQRLADGEIPRSRWARSTFGYVIKAAP